MTAISVFAIAAINSTSTGLVPLGWILGFAALFGVLIGSFLNVVIWRVPRGESLLLASHCPSCGAAVRPWQNIPVLSYLALRGRCAGCKTPIGVRYPLVELGTGLVFALVTWGYCLAFPGPSGDAMLTVAWWLGLIGYLWFAAAGIALAAIDARHQRLPDAIVLPSLAVVTVLLVAAATISGDWTRLWLTLGSGAALFALFLLIALIYPRGIGGGDVKLAPLIGVVLGQVGWEAVIVGTFAGFVCAAAVGIMFMLVGRAKWRSAIAFGPWMVLGAWVGIVWGAPLMRAYLEWAVPA